MEFVRLWYHHSWNTPKFSPDISSLPHSDRQNWKDNDKLGGAGRAGGQNAEASATWANNSGRMFLSVFLMAHILVSQAHFLIKSDYLRVKGRVKFSRPCLKQDNADTVQVIRLHHNADIVHITIKTKCWHCSYGCKNKIMLILFKLQKKNKKILTP